MATTYELQADGTLLVLETVVAAGGGKDAQQRRTSIAPWQIAAACRDQVLLADIQANAPADVKIAVGDAIQIAVLLAPKK